MGKMVEDFKDVFGVWRKGLKVDDQWCWTRSGQLWTCIRDRCNVGGIYQKKRPTYKGCSMSANFKDFQYFANWYTEQVGYGLNGYQIDKDILVSGNKVYSESTCILVPASLNLFPVGHGSARGCFKQGVSFDRRPRPKPYIAHISINGKSRNLGGFYTEDEAYLEYKGAKEAHAYHWYERLKAGEFVVDERVIERMRTWRLEDEQA